MKESEKLDKYLDIAKEPKNKTVENVAGIVVGALGLVPKNSEKKTGGIGNQRKNRDHPDNSIFNIG